MPKPLAGNELKSNKTNKEYMGYIKLMRLPLLAAIAIAQLMMHYLVAVPIIGISVYSFPTWQLVLMILSTLFIAAGGFVINDYYDMRIDEINRPLKRIVGNEVSKHDAMTFYIVLSVIGLLLSVVLGVATRSVDFCFIFITMIGLLWFYSSSYKRTLIIGNLIVAASIALIPFVVAMFESRNVMMWWGEQIVALYGTVTPDELKQANPTISTIYSTIGYFSIYVFGWMLIHEVIRNLDEINGERELECHTMPIVWGEKTAKYIGCGLIVLINIVCGYFLIRNIGSLQIMSVSYYVCSTLAFSAALIYFLLTAQSRRDYQICRLLVGLCLAAGICYSAIFWHLHQVAAASAGMMGM